MDVKLTKEHDWLMQLVGDWTFDSVADMGPDAPSQPTTGTEKVRAIGGAWIVCETTMEMDGAPATNIITLGYDVRRQKFVGSFVSSMMTAQWLYERTLNDSGTVLTLDSEGEDMQDPTKTSPYRDIVEISGPDSRALASQALGPDGEWVEFMRSTYRRA